MAAVVEASASGAGTGVAITPAGSDRVLYAFVSEDTNVDQNFTATFNTSETMDQIKETTGTGQYLAVFRLINPTATTANVVVTGADSVCVLALSGVDQTTPNDAIADATESASIDPISAPVVSSESGDLVVSGVSANGKTAANVTPTGTNQTQHQELEVGAGTHLGDVCSQPGDATVTATWDFNSATRASAIAFNVNAAGAGGGSSHAALRNARRMMLGI